MLIKKTVFILNEGLPMRLTSYFSCAQKMVLMRSLLSLVKIYSGELEKHDYTRDVTLLSIQKKDHDLSRLYFYELRSRAIAKKPYSPDVVGIEVIAQGMDYNSEKKCSVFSVSDMAQHQFLVASPADVWTTDLKNMNDKIQMSLSSTQPLPDNIDEIQKAYAKTFREMMHDNRLFNTVQYQTRRAKDNALINYWQKKQIEVNEQKAEREKESRHKGFFFKPSFTYSLFAATTLGLTGLMSYWYWYKRKAN